MIISDTLNILISHRNEIVRPACFSSLTFTQYKDTKMKCIDTEILKYFNEYILE